MGGLAQSQCPNHALVTALPVDFHKNQALSCQLKPPLLSQKHNLYALCLPWFILHVLWCAFRGHLLYEFFLIINCVNRGRSYVLNKLKKHNKILICGMT